MKMHDYFVIYKPYQVLSQFSPEGDKKTLASLAAFPKDVYPVGRLDYDSEGLLVLTNNPRINKLLLNPENKHERKYWIEVEGLPDTEAIAQLEKGVNINIDGKLYTTLPAKAFLMKASPALPERIPPIRFRKNIPTTWLSLTLKEGKNRQVRKMTAAVGFPTLRLVRYRIEKLTIEGFSVGEARKYDEKEILSLLNIR